MPAPGACEVPVLVDHPVSQHKVTECSVRHMPRSPCPLDCSASTGPPNLREKESKSNNSESFNCVTNTEGTEGQNADVQDLASRLMFTNSNDIRYTESI